LGLPGRKRALTTEVQGFHAISENTLQLSSSIE